jgi:DNA-binding transcriptional MerR regulator
VGRSEGGYRLFRQETIEELAIIRALRTIDVPIVELGKILEVRRAGVCNCSVLKESISTKIISIDERIDELASMRIELARLLEHWRDCGGKQLEAPS